MVSGLNKSPIRNNQKQPIRNMAQKNPANLRDAGLLTTYYY